MDTADHMINKVRYLQEFLQVHPDPSHFMVINSAWLALLEIRQNGDLDVLTTAEMRQKATGTRTGESFGLNPNKRKIRAHGESSFFVKFGEPPFFDEVIEKFSVEVEGIKFIQPGLYFDYKIFRFWKYFSELPEIVKKIVKYDVRKGLLVAEILSKKRGKKMMKDYNDLIAVKRCFDMKKHRILFPQMGSRMWGEERVREFAPLKFKS